MWENITLGESINPYEDDFYDLSEEFEENE